MASIGVGEAITAVTTLYKVAVKIKNASGAIAKIQKRIDRVKGDLEDIKKRIDDPKSPLGEADAAMYRSSPHSSLCQEIC